MNPEKVLKEIDKRLVAKPFVTFVIRCGKTDFRIKKRKEARFNHQGTLEVRKGGQINYLNADQVTLLEDNL